MRFNISGQHIDIGKSLATHVKTNLNDVLSKYAERPTGAQVSFKRDRHLYHCDLSVHLSSGREIVAHGKANDIYAAFDLSADKVAKQVRRYRRKLKQKHSERLVHLESDTLMAYQALSDESSDFSPMIIAERDVEFEKLSVDVAVTSLERSGLGFLFFRNEGTGKINFVHQRSDGHIGWIDP